jgi:plasmid stabilization system protein ParE
LRLVWTDEALADLENIAERAPRAAEHVLDAVEWLVEIPFPGMFRRLTERPEEHVLTVPPYVVFYRVAGDELEVLTIEDGRRRRTAW